jgi:transcriptional regulator with XRE-family HTH domain
MGTLADRMNGHATADAPISQPILRISPRCEVRHHSGCRSCDCPCHQDIDWSAGPRNSARGRSDSGWKHLEPEADLERELELVKISSLYLQGISRPGIAQRLGCTLPFIDNAITVMRRRWAMVSMGNIDAKIQEEIAKLNNLEAEHWSAWERSKANELPLEERQRLLRQYGIRVSAVGDAAFLNGILTCIDRRIKLQGLDAPIRVDITAKIRMMAEAAGLDPDEAVEEAKKVIAEARAALSAPVGTDDG